MESRTQFPIGSLTGSVKGSSVSGRTAARIRSGFARRGPVSVPASPWALAEFNAVNAFCREFRSATADQVEAWERSRRLLGTSPGIGGANRRVDWFAAQANRLRFRGGWACSMVEPDEFLSGFAVVLGVAPVAPGVPEAVVRIQSEFSGPLGSRVLVEACPQWASKQRHPRRGDWVPITGEWASSSRLAVGPVQDETFGLYLGPIRPDRFLWLRVTPVSESALFGQSTESARIIP